MRNTMRLALLGATSITLMAGIVAFTGSSSVEAGKVSPRQYDTAITCAAVGTYILAAAEARGDWQDESFEFIRHVVWANRSFVYDAAPEMNYTEAMVTADLQKGAAALPADPVAYFLDHCGGSSD